MYINIERESARARERAREREKEKERKREREMNPLEVRAIVFKNNHNKENTNQKRVRGCIFQFFAGLAIRLSTQTGPLHATFNPRKKTKAVWRQRRANIDHAESKRERETGVNLLIGHNVFHDERHNLKKTRSEE